MFMVNIIDLHQLYFHYYINLNTLINLFLNSKILYLLFFHYYLNINVSMFMVFILNINLLYFHYILNLNVLYIMVTFLIYFFIHNH
jgi:hypothetical protein